MKQFEKLTPLKNQDEFIATALAIFQQSYVSAMEQYGSFIVAVSGGNTPLPFFEALATDEVAQRFDWEKIHIFWVDERMVPNHSPENNFNNAYQVFLRKVPLPYPNKHRIHTFKDGDDVAKDYEREIRSVFAKLRGTALNAESVPAFDLILLGMGTDGHTASLFPTSPDLNEDEKLVMAVMKPGSEQMRISMTFPLLAAAEHVCVLATGDEKLAIIEKVNEGGLLHLPIAKLKQKHPNLLWVTRL